MDQPHPSPMWKFRGHTHNINVLSKSHAGALVAGKYFLERMFSLIKLAARLLASSVETPRCRIFNNVIIAGQDIVHFGNKSYLLLAEKRSARGSPEESGGTGLSPVRPAIPRPFEGTSASDLDRTYVLTTIQFIQLGG